MSHHQRELKFEFSLDNFLHSYTVENREKPSRRFARVANNYRAHKAVPLCFAHAMIPPTLSLHPVHHLSLIQGHFARWVTRGMSDWLTVCLNNKILCARRATVIQQLSVRRTSGGQAGWVRGGFKGPHFACYRSRRVFVFSADEMHA